MSTDEIIKRTVGILAYILDVNANRVSIHSSICNTRGWDSLVTMQFIIGVEKEFDIAVNIEDAENFTSIERVVDILVKKYLQ